MNTHRVTISSRILLLGATILALLSVNVGGASVVKAGSPSSGSPVSAGKYDGTHSNWTYSGSWALYSTSGPFNNTLTYSTTVGNEATFVMTGSQFKLTYTQYTNRGVVDIYVDGSKVHSLNQNGSLQWQKTWTSSSLSNGTHTLRFVHASGTMVDLDAIEVLGTAAPTCYALTLSHTGQGSDPAASPANSSGCPAGQYQAGASISLSGAAPASGWQVSNWTGTTDNASTASTNTLTMPASAHTASVNYSTTYGPGKYDGTHSGWTYSGTWALYSTSGPFNNTLTYSTTVGNEATFVMTGSQFVLTYNQYTNRGVVDIYIDGAKVHSLNQNGALQWQKTWSSSALSNGTHTLRFVHASGAMVDLDAIEVFGTASQTCYALTLGHAGQGSNPVASPANSTGCPGGQYLAGASISLSGAAPASGWQVSNWTGTTNNASTASTNTVTMPTSAHTANVNYTASGGGLGPGKYDGTHSGWTHIGTWPLYSTAGPYDNTLNYSTAVGNEATFVMTGSQFKLTYTQYTNRGVVDIYVDGAKVHSLNQNGSLQWQKTWTSSVLSNGTHTLRFVHASGTMVDLDAIEVFGTASQTCYALTLSHTGQGSDPAASPANSTGCLAGQYQAGASISLSGATPASGWQISNWTGTTNNASTASTNTLTMPASAHTANVNYTAGGGGLGPGKYDGAHSGWTYSGAWALYSTSGPYNNTLNYSTTPGSEATFVMTGSQFVLTYNQYTNRGVVDIYIDGAKVHSLNQNGALQWQKTWSSSALSSGTHTLRFVHAGGGTYVDIDAIEVLSSAPPPPPQGTGLEIPIVFVSRQIPRNGSAYYNATGSLPGVQPWGRFQVAAPGKLMVREVDGSLRALVDGSNPSAVSLNLIDVNAPDVSYDASKIVFAGLPSGSYSTSPMNNPGAWRIYVINVDGSGLRQVTFSDRNVSLVQFGNVASSFTRYDDTDPVWLPDGRIAFSSTRWPSFGQYGAALTSNLHVVNADGTGLHRITAERNGADRPQVDPLTGRIVYSRWWRNFRLGTNSMQTLVAPEGGYILKDGLCALSRQGAECQEAGGLTNLERNSWHMASINPDGTGLAQFAGRSNTTFVGEIANLGYGGAFAADGSFYANFFPMANGTEAAGFGGIRHYERGPHGYTPIIGITTRDEDVQEFVVSSPPSYGVYNGEYAAEPAVLPDGRLVISWAKDVAQDYGLYIIDLAGGNLTRLYDNPGTTELRTRLLVPRPLPPVIPDKVTAVASPLPPLASGPYDIDGTFTFEALNVYFNAPVDVDIMNAMPVGSADSIRFFVDHQRSQQRGSFETLDWPIFLQEVTIDPDGSVTATSPANVPLFEQIRTSQPGYTIPLTGSNVPSNEMTGAAHVAGMNFGRTGEVQRCVGCHAGHTMIPVPANPADAQWTNLAPGATVSVSSQGSGSGRGLVDRRVRLDLPFNNGSKFWFSRSGQSPSSQWVQLTFPVPVTVRTVRLYNIPSADSQVRVLDTTVRLYSDAGGAVQVASSTSGALSENGTDVPFDDVKARVVRIEFTSVNGSVAGLAEVEVIARGEAGP